MIIAVFILGMAEETNAVRWMISLEGRVICECVESSFLTALATLFAVYYVFNLQYQEEASCTLEFVSGPGWNDPMTAVVPRVKGFACYSLSFSRHNKNIKMEHFFLYILSRYLNWSNPCLK